MKHTEDNSGVQTWSKGDVYPWVHTYVENQDRGWGEYYYKHPDGRETQHRRFNLVSNANTPEGCECWSTIAYRVAEEDVKEAIKRDRKPAEARDVKKPAIRTSGTLENGAEIIAQVGIVVVAKYGHEYATWLVDSKLNASVGRYFPGNGTQKGPLDLVNAMHDFIERVHVWHGNVL